MAIMPRVLRSFLVLAVQGDVGKKPTKHCSILGNVTYCDRLLDRILVRRPEFCLEDGFCLNPSERYGRIGYTDVTAFSEK